MNFFEQQDKARSKTSRLVIMFLTGILVLGIIAFVAVYMGYILFIGGGYNVEEEAISVVARIRPLQSRELEVSAAEFHDETPSARLLLLVCLH